MLDAPYHLGWFIRNGCKARNELSRGQKAIMMSRKPYVFHSSLALALLSGGCATNQYMGISLKPGDGDPVAQALAAKAQSGDKQSQYELGRWFEDSTDPNGLKKAIKLYRIAAIPRGGIRLLYLPGASGVATSIISTGRMIEGHLFAGARVKSLKSSKLAMTTAGKFARLRIRSKQCSVFSFKKSSCFIYVQSPEISKVSPTNVILLKKPYIDISGMRLCSGKICILDKDQFYVGRSLSLNDLIKPVYSSNVLVGILVIQSNADYQSEDLFLLTPYGESLTPKRLSEISRNSGFDIKD